MYRVFCDICEKDITDYAGDRIKATVGRLTVEVMIAIDNTWNGGHACEECIKKAVAKATMKRKPKK